MNRINVRFFCLFVCFFKELKGAGEVTQTEMDIKWGWRGTERGIKGDREKFEGGGR